MAQPGLYNYIYEIFSNCFRTLFITKITINNYNYYNYKKDILPDSKANPLCIENYEKENYKTENYEKENNVFDLIDITNNTNGIYKNINLRLTCFECKSQIFGEIFMFNDKSFCRKVCRKKNMDKLMKF